MRAVDHPVAAEEVMAYLDGELDGTRETIVQAHLATCERCQDIASRLRSLSTELSEWQVAGVPVFAAPQPARVEGRQRSRWWRGARVWRLAGAAAVLTVFTAWLFVNQSAQNMPVTFPSDRDSSSAELASARAALAESPLAYQAVDPPQPRRIVRTASLTLIVTDFPAVRPAVDRVLQDVGGFLGQISVNHFADSQTMTAVLRVPASRLEDAIRALKGLGHATTETQAGDDVGEQVTDLDVRLANARTTEARLGDLMRNRTGTVSQVLEVEREIARVREEIERMAARREELERRITYATLTLNVSVQRQASLSSGPVPVATELRNAFVEGLRYAYESALLAVAFILSAAPVVLLWTVLLWFPIRALLRARRARRSDPSSAA